MHGGQSSANNYEDGMKIANYERANMVRSLALAPRPFLVIGVCQTSCRDHYVMNSQP